MTGAFFRIEAGRASTANRCAASSSAHDQHQMGTGTERGQSLALGTCRLALAADKPQFKLGRTLHHRLFSHWPAEFPSSRFVGQLVVERAFAGALAITNFRDHPGANRSVVHSTVRQHRSDCLADVMHFPIVLSKPRSLAGSKSASKRGQIIGNSGQVGAA